MGDKNGKPTKETSFFVQFLAKRWGEHPFVYEYKLFDRRQPKNFFGKERVTKSFGAEDNLFDIDFISNKALLEETVFKAVDQCGSDGLDFIEKEVGQICYKGLGYHVHEVPHDPEIRSNWCVFIRSIQERHPRMLEFRKFQIQNEFETELDKITEEHYQSQIRGPSCPETLQEAKHQISSIGYEKFHWPMYIISRIMSEIINHFIINMEWYVISIEENAYISFLTSDMPVIMYSGLALPDGHIAMPIGPYRLFVAFNRNQGLLQKLISENKTRRELVEKVNKVMVGQASIFVCAKDDRQRRFIENRFRLDLRKERQAYDLANRTPHLASKKSK